MVYNPSASHSLGTSLCIREALVRCGLWERPKYRVFFRREQAPALRFLGRRLDGPYEVRVSLAFFSPLSYHKNNERG